MPEYQVIIIANPPPRGVGITCRLLSLGILITFLFKAIKRISAVREKDNINNPDMIRIIFIYLPDDFVAKKDLTVLLIPSSVE